MDLCGRGWKDMLFSSPERKIQWFAWQNQIYLCFFSFLLLFQNVLAMLLPQFSSWLIDYRCSISLHQFVLTFLWYVFSYCIPINANLNVFILLFSQLKKSALFLNLVVVNNLPSQSQSNALSKDKKQLAIMILIFYHFF